MLARAGAVDEIGVRVFDHGLVAVARDVPHHHLLALLDGLAAQFDVARRVAAHMRERRLPADRLRHHVRDDVVVLPQLLILIGILVQREDGAADRVARGVVAAHDEQDQVSQIFHAIHVARRRPMRQQRDQIVLRRRVHALVPQVHEILDAFIKFCAAFLLRILLAGEEAGVLARGRHIGPARQLAAVFPRKIEQGRERHRRQLDGHLVHPVELFVQRQIVQDLRRAFADHRLQILQIHRRHRRVHRLALHVMLGRVHRDEHGKLKVFLRVRDGDGGFGRERFVVGVHRHDVVVLGHRPVRPELMLGGVVHRVFFAQALEIRPHRIGAEKLRIGGTDLGERHGIGALAGGLLQIVMQIARGDVHGGPPDSIFQSLRRK